MSSDRKLDAIRTRIAAERRKSTSLSVLLEDVERILNYTGALLAQSSVIIHVRDGVPECVSAPDGIDVQIIDLDSLDEQELSQLYDKLR
jgi:hypothetical protein